MFSAFRKIGAGLEKAGKGVEKAGKGVGKGFTNAGKAIEGKIKDVKSPRMSKGAATAEENADDNASQRSVKPNLSRADSTVAVLASEEANTTTAVAAVEEQSPAALSSPTPSDINFVMDQGNPLNVPATQQHKSKSPSSNVSLVIGVDTRVKSPDSAVFEFVFDEVVSPQGEGVASALDEPAARAGSVTFTLETEGEAPPPKAQSSLAPTTTLTTAAAPASEAPSGRPDVLSESGSTAPTHAVKLPTPRQTPTEKGTSNHHRDALTAVGKSTPPVSESERGYSRPPSALSNSPPSPRSSVCASVRSGTDNPASKKSEGRLPTRKGPEKLLASKQKEQRQSVLKKEAERQGDSSRESGAGQGRSAVKAPTTRPSPSPRQKAARRGGGRPSAGPVRGESAGSDGGAAPSDVAHVDYSEILKQCRQDARALVQRKEATSPDSGRRRPSWKSEMRVRSGGRRVSDDLAASPGSSSLLSEQQQQYSRRNQQRHLNVSPRYMHERSRRSSPARRRYADSDVSSNQSFEVSYRSEDRQLYKGRPRSASWTEMDADWYRANSGRRGQCNSPEDRATPRRKSDYDGIARNRRHQGDGLHRARSGERSGSGVIDSRLASRERRRSSSNSVHWARSTDHRPLRRQYSASSSSYDSRGGAGVEGYDDETPPSVTLSQRRRRSASSGGRGRPTPAGASVGRPSHTYGPLVVSFGQHTNRSHQSSSESVASRVRDPTRESVMKDVVGKLNAMAEQITYDDAVLEREMLRSPWERLYHLNNRRERDERRATLMRYHKLEKIHEKLATGAFDREVQERAERRQRQEERLASPDSVYMRLYNLRRRPESARDPTASGDGGGRRRSSSVGANNDSSRVSSFSLAKPQQRGRARSAPRDKRYLEAMYNRLYQNAADGEVRRRERVAAAEQERHEQERVGFLAGRLLSRMERDPRFRNLGAAEREWKARSDVRTGLAGDAWSFEKELLRGPKLTRREQKLVSTRLLKHGWVSREKLEADKARLELEGCTFKPQVNEYPPRGNSTTRNCSRASSDVADHYYNHDDRWGSPMRQRGSPRRLPQRDRCKVLYDKAMRSIADGEKLQEEKRRAMRLDILKSRLASDHHFRRRVELDPSLAERFMKSLTV